MLHSRRIAVTGATGFLGRALCAHLMAHGHDVCGVVRAIPAAATLQRVRSVAIGNISETTDWTAAFSRAECVIHCAARAHVMQETAVDPLEAYRAVNVTGTKRLVKQAAALGVQRVIYVSSIGVLGIHTNGRGPFTPADKPQPMEAYAISKREAEDAVRDAANASGLEFVIVRPPLVYGEGVKGNLLTLLQWIARGWPLPFGRVNNRRSFIGVTNLADLLMECTTNAAAAGQTLLAADGDDLSTPQLIKLIGYEMGRPARLIPIPRAALHAIGTAFGKQRQLHSLTGSLQVDGRHTREILGWHPKESVTDGIKKMILAHGTPSLR